MKIHEIGARVTPKKWYCQSRLEKLILGKVAVVKGYNDDSPEGLYYELGWEDKEARLPDGRTLDEAFSHIQADALRTVPDRPQVGRRPAPLTRPRRSP